MDNRFVSFANALIQDAKQLDCNQNLTTNKTQQLTIVLSQQISMHEE